MSDRRKAIPRHVAIIMDGNGRWAKKHALNRISGHRKGADAVRSVINACLELGIPYLTLYAFSVDNWNRPAKEVNALMKLLIRHLVTELPSMMKGDIRLNVIGDISRLTEDVQAEISKVLQETEQNKAMVLTLALNYGGREDIVQAVQKLLNARDAGLLPQQGLNKEVIGQYLFTATIPDPDLLIRTSGEYRLSNFFLWQAAYTELYFTDVLWPDFSKDDLLKAIEDFQNRERRFGKTSDQLVETN